MANPMFEMLGNQNPMNVLVSQVENFKKQFANINPKEEVQKLLNSGRMSQQEFNQYMQTAQQITQMMGRR